MFLLRSFRVATIVIGLVSSSFLKATAQHHDSLSNRTGPNNLYFSLEGLHLTNEDRFIVNGNTRIKLFRLGDEAGIIPTNVYYEVDESNRTRYVGPFKIEEEGLHIVTYFDEKSPKSSFSVVVDKTCPVIDVAIVYKSITLKRFHFTETLSQDGTSAFECPVGSEMRILVSDAVSGVEYAFLKEGNALLTLEDGSIELRSRGQHTYKIVASDLAYNTTESGQISLIILEH